MANSSNVNPDFETYQAAHPFNHADFVGDAIDQLVTIEAKNLGMPHRVAGRLYDAARAYTGGRPTSMLSAERLIKTIAPGDSVLIVTGAGYAPSLPFGENDGPPGAASIARVLYKGLGAVPVYVGEQCHMGPVVASSHAAGVMVKTFEEARDRRLGATTSAAPLEQAHVAEWAHRLFDTVRPVAVIAAERLGPGVNGVIHNATGHPWSGPHREISFDAVDIAPVMTEAAQRGILTIGIGDHGNEFGFGAIRQAVLDVMPNGHRSCTTVATDIVVVAMMSNWGCYGIEAAIAFLKNDLSLMHSARDEERIVRACLDAGGLEAINCSTDSWVDGLDVETSMAVVQFLRNIVSKALEPRWLGFAH